MKIKEIDYKFKNKNLHIRFKKYDHHDNDSNTYNLILGNNGSGKSSLLEAIINYYSPNYSNNEFNSKIITENEERPRKVILSAYSPYDRIRIQKEKRILPNLPIEKENGATHDVEIIYPNRSLDKIVGMACSAYYHCKINHKPHFKKVEEQISNLLHLSDDSIFLLIEKFNQIDLDYLQIISNRRFNSNFIELINKRLQYFEEDVLESIKEFCELINIKNEILKKLNNYATEESEISNKYKHITYRSFQRIFRTSIKSDDKFNIKFKNEYIKFNDNKNYNLASHEDEKINKYISQLSEHVDVMLVEFNYLTEILNISKKNINYLLDFREPENFKVFFLLAYLKDLYKKIKSLYGQETKFESQNKKLLQISKIKDFYDNEYFDSGTMNTEYLMRADFDILEAANIYLIDDLIIKRNNDYYSLSTFSSGELSIFLRIMEISLYIENNSLILIDEPEIHLNPTWIVEYYHILKTCFENMNSHFIITSQSPLIVSLFHKPEVIYLSSSNNDTYIKYIEEETFINSIDNIMKFVFGFDNYKNPIYKDEVKKITQYASTDLFSALDRLNNIADNRYRNEISSQILSSENIQEYFKLIGEDITIDNEIDSEVEIDDDY